MRPDASDGFGGFHDDAPVFVISVAAQLAGMHAQTLRQYDRLGLVSPGRTAGGGRYLWDDGAVLGRPAHATDTAPASALFCGDFSMATMYLYGGLDLLIDRRYLTSGGKVKFVATVYADLVVSRPAAFSRATIIT